MVPPTPSDFTTRFPAFASIDPTVLAAALAEAGTRVDASWTPGDYPLGVMLYAAHVLTLDGQGSGAEAALGAAGALGFTTLRAGTLHAERAAPAKGESSLADTTYGRRFLALLKVNQPSVLVP
jgi:hypothetical protein